jgi:hypothetical protein
MSSSILRPPRLSRSLHSTCRYQRGHSSQAVLARSTTSFDPQPPHSSIVGQRFNVSPQAGVIAATTKNLKVDTTRYKRSRTSKTNKGEDLGNEPRQNPLEPNAVDLHLEYLQRSEVEPTLSDINGYRPADHSAPESQQYSQEYRVLCETLLRTFSKAQLRRFCEMYGLDSKYTRPRRKINYAEAIIEQAWNWPSLSEIEKQKMDRTQIEVKCR